MSYTQNTVHLIFSTKDRQCFIDTALQDEMNRYLFTTFKSNCGYARIINGYEDHVHILGDLKSRISLADAVKLLKTSSSKWMKQQGITEFSWQPEYAAFSVSASSIEKVYRYISGQQEHHRKMSFREELVQFLDKHGVRYNPDYLLA